MCEPLVAHEIIGLEGRLEIVPVNSNRYAHKQVLGPLSYALVLYSQKVRSLQSFEPKKVVVVVQSIVYLLVNRICVLHHYLVCALTYQGCWSPA